MTLENYIDKFMKKNGSPDPVKNKKVKLDCAAYVARAMVENPEPAAPPNAKEITMGDVYRYLELPAEAITFYDKALKIVPRDYQTIFSKIQTLLTMPEKQKCVDYIETIMTDKFFTEDQKFLTNIRITYLATLSILNQTATTNYLKTVNYMLANHDELVDTHVYAARYHEALDEPHKYIHHLARVVQIIRDDETNNERWGNVGGFLSTLATATEIAIEARDKNKAWLFISHLMNSEYDPAKVLQLREAAARVFPAQKNNNFTNNL